MTSSSETAWVQQEALSQNPEPKSYRTLTEDWGFKGDRKADNVVNDIRCKRKIYKSNRQILNLIAIQNRFCLW